MTLFCVVKDLWGWDDAQEKRYKSQDSIPYKSCTQAKLGMALYQSSYVKIVCI